MAEQSLPSKEDILEERREKRATGIAAGDFRSGRAVKGLISACE
jgi:hypothetical protein